MEYYDFEVIKGDTMLAQQRAVALAEPKSAWPKIARLAQNFDQPGCKIRVRNESGELVIQIGVVAANQMMKKKVLTN